MRPIDYFDRAVESGPERLFVTGNDRPYSYRDAQKFTWDVNRALVSRGYSVGDSVAILSPNCPEAVLCIFAVFRAGGAWTPVNIRNSAGQNAQFLTFAGTKWLFYHSEASQQARQIYATVPGLHIPICIDGDDGFGLSMQNFLTGTDEVSIADWSDPFGAPKVTFARWPTGGTTGPSKAVEMSNRVAHTMIELGLQYYVGDLTEDIVYLAVAPITHAAGIMAPIFAAKGGRILTLPKFDAALVLESIASQSVTHIFLPPTALYSLIEASKLTTSDLSSLRQIIVAAAPVAPSKLREAIEIFGPVVAQCYGQAEAPMLISWMGPEDLAAAAAGDRPARLASCGLATSATQIAILDDHGNRLERGGRGEICVRGPLVTEGYFRNDAETRQAKLFGWHHTGDIGYIDDDDYLYIVDRKKDMIISGGFNIYASEVESSILSISKVYDAAVIGLPDDHWGEVVVAIVVLNPETTLDAQTIIERVRADLGAYKAPKRVEFWNDLPKTGAGKIDKKAIREALSK